MLHAQLKKNLGLVPVIALGLGTAVGVSLFSVMAPAAAVAGTGMLLSVLVAGLPFSVIAMTYAFMGSALPTSGASYEWPRRFIHPFAGFLVAWLGIAGSVSAMLVLALVLVRYLSKIFDLGSDPRPWMLGLFVVIFTVNYFGAAVAARVQACLLGLLLLALAVFAILGFPHVGPENVLAWPEAGWGGVLAAVPLLVGLFFGIEAATEMGEEINNGRKTIPLSIAISAASAMVLYLIVGAVVLGVLGGPALSVSTAPLVDAAERFLGPWAEPLIVTSAVIAIGKSLNASFMLFSRNLFAMGRSGILPPMLGRVHATRGAPHVAAIAVLGLCSAGLLLPSSLTFLFLAVNVPTLLKYLGASIAAIRVADGTDGLYERAHFKLGRGATKFWAIVGAFFALAMIGLGIDTDWRPYAALATWAALGTFYYSKRSRSGGVGA